MSITYSRELANVTIWTLPKILLKWTGSLIQTMWIEAVIIFASTLILTVILSLVSNSDEYPLINYYVNAFVNESKSTFDRIPISLVLGFYVSLVLNRWYDQMNLIPWPDEVAVLVASYIDGNDDNAILIRRQIMRYLMATYVMGARYFFTDLKKMFQSDKDFVKAGFLTAEELEIIDKADVIWDKYFLPSNWAINLVYEAYRSKLITSDVLLDSLVNKIADFRGAVGTFFMIDYVNPPIAYTQVAGVVVYSYILVAVVAVQRATERNEPFSVEYIFMPVLRISILIFYLAWYKIAEQLMNPFGKSRFNFDTIYCIQRDIQVSYLMVDHLCTNHPSILPTEKEDGYADLHNDYDDETAAKNQELDFIIEEDYESSMESSQTASPGNKS